MIGLFRKNDEDRGPLVWGARTDVGLQRPHNEDSYTSEPPLFAVCDGMGGHEAGEVASAIAIDTIVRHAPTELDDAALGKAIEEANAAILTAADQGIGKPGMGCTATAVMIVEEKMAVAHVGDSRCYLLRGGSLVRVTHDHSYVEELVDAGEITADEARVHPARSIITRALGSEADLYADHFTIDMEKGDRVILCSDGLNSMIPDELIEDVAVTSPTPQGCADALVKAALNAGGHDNVTVLVVDVARDVVAERHVRNLRRSVRAGILVVVATIALVLGLVNAYISQAWFLGVDSGRVAIFHGVNGTFAGHDFYELVERTEVDIEKLPDATRKSLEQGIATASREEARATVDSYVEQITTEQAKADEAHDAVEGAETPEKPTGEPPAEVAKPEAGAADAGAGAAPEAAPDAAQGGGSNG